MRDELMVETEGQYDSLDLGSETKVVLKYKSNIFTDISKIVSNVSYTIRVPITLKNKRIIDNAELPYYESRFTHRKHYAQYFKNGLQVVKNALAVLLATTSKSYELALTWGNVSRFSEMVNKGESLNELSGNDFIVWNQQLSGVNHGDFFIPYILEGIRTDSNIFYHPAVKVSWILDKIQSDNNIILLFPDDKKEFINKLMIPLLSKNGGMPNDQESRHTYTIKGTYNDGYIWENVDNPNVLKYFSYEFSKGGSYIIRFTSKLKGKIKVRPNIESSYNDLSIVVGNGNEPTYKRLESRYVDSSNYHYVYEYPLEIEVSVGDVLYIARDGANVSADYGPNRKNLDLSIIPDEVITGIAFPITINLPDIKQIDFIKALCNMLGLFAIPVEGSNNTIRMVTLDAIYENKAKAYDWTNKLIKSAIDTGGAKEIKYALSDFARVNWFKYKADETVRGNYDGYIQVDDDSLNKEKDMVTLPFVGCDTARGVASIPLYITKDKDDGTFELEYKECQPRILIEKNNGRNAIGSFEGLSFSELLYNNYSYYKEVVKRPKIIKENIYLTNYELMSLDLTVPAYLGQYARYYAIVTIEAKENNICECELLQL